jgi:uncharacterized membrane protein YeaQ/YmgE (transglycosylase-associated protein family)
MVIMSIWHTRSERHLLYILCTIHVCCELGIGSIGPSGRYYGRYWHCHGWDICTAYVVSRSCKLPSADLHILCLTDSRLLVSWWYLNKPRILGAGCRSDHLLIRATIHTKCSCMWWPKQHPINRWLTLTDSLWPQAKLSSNWFPDSQRAMATTIGTISGPVGAAFGLVIPSVLHNVAHNLTAVLIFDAVLATVLFVALVAVFRSRPAVPPSYSAHDQQRAEVKDNSTGLFNHVYLDSIKVLFTNANYIMVLVTYSMNLAAFQALATLINQITSPYGYSSVQSSIMGAVVVLLGVVGAGVFSRVIDRFRVYKLALFVSYACTVYFNVLWAALLWPDQYVVLHLALALARSLSPTCAGALLALTTGTTCVLHMKQYGVSDDRGRLLWILHLALPAGRCSGGGRGDIPCTRGNSGWIHGDGWSGRCRMQAPTLAMVSRF